jgi:hypothetical protein
VAAIAAVLGGEIRFEVVTPTEARERYRAQGGFAAANADKPTRTFAEGARGQAEDCRGLPRTLGLSGGGSAPRSGDG